VRRDGNGQEMPMVEPSADTRAGAHSIAEMYVALRREGFTEQQALIIVGQVVAASVMRGTSE
jgi:hypothetical protein